MILDAEQRDWQLDLLRERRDARLADNDRQRADIWDEYNRAVAALSTDRTKVGA